MASVLDSPMPSVAPRRDRKTTPFAVAVDRNTVITVRPAVNEFNTIPSFLGQLNVAVESLIDELCPVFGSTCIDSVTLGKNTKMSDIWVSGGKLGIHRADD